MRITLVICLWMGGLVCQNGNSVRAFSQEVPVNQDAPAEDPPANDAVEESSAEVIEGFEWLGSLTTDQLATAAQIDAPRPSKTATNEAGKLLWNLRRLPRGAVEQRCEPWGLKALADLDASPDEPRMLSMQGRAVRIDAVRIPAEMAEVLEVELIYRTTVQVGPEQMQVVTLEAPKVWAAREDLDEPITFCGLCVRHAPWNGDTAREGDATVPEEGATIPEDGETESGETESGEVPPDGDEGVTNETPTTDALPVVAFATKLQWYPESGWPTGWLMLSNYGFDLSQFSTTMERMREPLSSDDRDSFYGMLSIANQLSSSAKALEQADDTETIALLRRPRELAGRWIQVKLTTARVSRVVLQEPELIERLGREDYWQVDCFGELNDVRVVLESGEGDGEPLVFENRFPVSVAVGDLPPWLEQRVNQGAGADARIDARMISEPIVFTGFAYRLWSYESDYTESRGGRQVAPLLVASNLLEDSIDVDEGAGAEIFGWFLAGFVIAAVLITAFVVWRTERHDRLVKQRGRGLSS